MIKIHKQLLLKALKFYGSLKEGILEMLYSAFGGFLFVTGKKKKLKKSISSSLINVKLSFKLINNWVFYLAIKINKLRKIIFLILLVKNIYVFGDAALNDIVLTAMDPATVGWKALSRGLLEKIAKEQLQNCIFGFIIISILLVVLAEPKELDELDSNFNSDLEEASMSEEEKGKNK